MFFVAAGILKEILEDQTHRELLIETSLNGDVVMFELPKRTKKKLSSITEVEVCHNNRK